jgi:hypothetical protein
MKFWKRRSELGNLEAELHDARPEASDQFVQSVSRRLEPRHVPFRRLRIALAAALTLLLLAAFGATGGVGYAMKSAEAVLDVNGNGGGDTLRPLGGGGDEDDDDGGRGDDDDDGDPGDDQHEEDDDDGDPGDDQHEEDDDDGGDEDDDDGGDGDD